MNLENESKFAETMLTLSSIKSGLLLMQQAVENEVYPASNEDIDNYLDILIEKFNITINNLKDLADEIQN